MAPPGAELAAALVVYERIEEVLGRLVSYAQLQFSSDSTDPAVGSFYQSITERVTIKKAPGTWQGIAVEYSW